jgi:uncharacterized protein
MRNVLTSTIVAVLLALGAVAQEVPERPARLLTDKAGVLSSVEVETLEKSLVRISRYGLAQAVVYIDRKIPAGAEFEAYTLKTANAWGVGSAEKNDGVVLFVFLDDRKMRIEVGKGLEDVLTNEVAQSIIDNELRPAFREERYGFGLVRALDTIARTLDAGRSLKAQEARKKAG